MFLILRNSRFRLLWASSVVSELGIMFHFTAHGWLTLTVTDSAFWVGAVAGTAGASIMLFSIVSGVLADRFNRKYLILLTMVCQGCVAAALATLIFREQIQLWHILCAAVAEGAMVSIRVPSRLALMMDVAGRPNVQNATAANFAAMTGTGIVVPPLAGQLIENYGIGWAYMAMACAFAASILALSMLRGIKGADRKGGASPVDFLQGFLRDFVEGAKFVFSTPAVRALVLLMLSSELLGWAHEAMIPVMARDELRTGPAGVGYLISAGSTGALLSALTLSAVGDIRRKGLALVLGYIGFGAFLIMFALSKSLLLSLALLAASWASVAMYETMLTTLLQTSVPNEMRGRVLSFQTFTWGLSGLSGFQTGAIAALLGAPLAIGIGGGVLVLNGLRLVRSLSSKYREDEPALQGESAESSA